MGAGGSGGRNVAAEQKFEQAGASHMQGRLDEAERLYRAALQLDPDHIGSLHNLGILCFQRGQYDEAVALTQEVVRLRPDLPVAFNTLAVALMQLGRFEEAESSSRKAIALAPHYAEAHNTRANVLVQLRRFEEAEACCREALRLQPQYTEALSTLGSILLSGARAEEAEAAWRELLRLNPGHADGYKNLGNTLVRQGKYDEASTYFNEATRLTPDDADTLVNAFYIKQCMCDWSRYREGEARLRKGLKAPVPPAAAFRLLGCQYTSEDHLNYARLAAATIAVPKSEMLSIPPPSPHKRLRLGYLSGAFHVHAVAYLSAGLLEHHDRERFELIAYAFDRDDGSEIRRRLVSAFDRFVDIYEMRDADAARRIHTDSVDILVDLHGLTPDGRAKILAYRPAPLQVNYLGHPGTMGADFIDYIIADPFVIPPDQQPFFSEQIVYLPDCYQCNDDKREIAEQTPLRADCGLPDRGFVFCCFNNTFKITPDFFDIWMRLLRALPGSVLWLFEANKLVRANLEREAKARGVAPERLVFAPKLPQAEHLARHRLADLFLDTLPYNAHTTASDALWAGLPVLTCAGDTFAGRVAGSLLRAIGLDELITASPREYEALALQLARDPERLARLRARLMQNRRTYPLFDTERYTRHLEASYLRMHELRKSGQPPTGFSIVP